MNEFTRKESELVNRIIKWLQTQPQMTEHHRKGMILHFACGWVRTYASPEDYGAAVDAVIALVDERWNAQHLPAYG